jgi:hypothetical protein
MNSVNDIEQALWHSIGEQPEDRLRRGVLADWYEENAGTVVCERCKGEGFYSVYERGEYGPDRWLETCVDCAGMGYVSNGFIEMAEALKATADKVPWVAVRSQGYGWWCKMPFHTSRSSLSHCIDRVLMDIMSESEERISLLDLVRFEKSSVDDVGGHVLFRTSATAIRVLCCAWVKVHRG